MIGLVYLKQKATIGSDDPTSQNIRARLSNSSPRLPININREKPVLENNDGPLKNKPTETPNNNQSPSPNIQRNKNDTTLDSADGNETFVVKTTCETTSNDDQPTDTVVVLTLDNDQSNVSNQPIQFDNNNSNNNTITSLQLAEMESRILGQVKEMIEQAHQQLQQQFHTEFERLYQLLNKLLPPAAKN